jgi:hypothetical protein
MKTLQFFVFIALFISAGAFAERRWEEPAPQPPLRSSTDNINPGDVACWAGNPNVVLPIDTAYLLVKFTDGKRESSADSILLWGYRFNPSTQKTSLDMIRAVGNADKRFIVLLQSTGYPFGYTAGGFGYNYAECARVPLAFDLAGAAADPRVFFKYSGDPNTGRGQGAVPLDPQRQADDAISAANSTGIIEHPFNVNYGLNAYDYDWWHLTDTTNIDHEWQSGYTQAGTWNFFTKDQLNGPFSLSPTGIESRMLKNNFVDGFAFGIQMAAVDMSGSYEAYDCRCK